jgi:hypothetical protein
MFLYIRELQLPVSFMPKKSNEFRQKSKLPF